MTERDGLAPDGGAGLTSDGAASDSVPHEITLVGIGASAGGLAALRDFFRAVPPDSDLAFVVIVHLDPDHQSQMAGLLQSQTTIPVSQISESFHPQPNHVYVIPPNKNLSARGDAIELGPRDAHAPIDLFFRTLADSYGPNAVGVVLSGTGSDGTAGIRRIHAVGGVTIVQAPEEAEFASMPRSAIATGMVDAVLPVGEMPERLVALKGANRLIPTKGRGVTDQDPSASVRLIHRRLLNQTGHDFSQYKRSTFLRRLERRMRSRRVETVTEYARVLEVDVEEVGRLFQDLLISVSSFFRDPLAWAALERQVIPGLFEGKGPDESVRAWVAGCATGEEAYTLAMLLKEHAATLSDPPRIQIFATDIDERACREARAGVYPATISGDVSPDRLQRFFQPGNAGRVVESLRESVLFASHDLLLNPPFSKLDLITCRNVLIYLESAAQDRVLRTFHYALGSRGHLFLGPSEFAGEHGLFAPVDSKNRIYVRVDLGARVLPGRVAYSPGRSAGRGDPVPNANEDFPGFSYGPLHLRMLEEYAPPSLVVDSSGRIVHLSPGAGRYIRLPGGVPKWNVVELVSSDMRVELRALLHEVFHDGAASHRAVQVDIDGHPRVIDLRVSPLSGEDGRKGHALVIFDERPSTEKNPRDADGNPTLAEPDPGTVDRLTKELARAREQLTSALDERDVTVEKLQATNEELQSINEQHRTALEEMETSNEELQSLNEELTTVNQEHRATIDELKHTTADLNNLVEASSVATIFLDRQLNVRRFSPSVSSIFNLRPQDQGRPLSHFTHVLNYDTMVADAERTLSAMDSLEREASDDAGKWYSVRMRPYRFGDDRIGGVVITLYDITEAKRQQAAEIEARARAEAEEGRLEALMRQLPAGVLIVEGRSGDVLSANDRAHDIWGRSGLPFASPPGAAGAGYSARAADGTSLDGESWPIYQMVRTGQGIRGEEIEISFEDGRHSVLLMNGVPVRAVGEAHAGDQLGAIVTLLDITDRKAIEEELRTAKGRAEVANRTKSFFMSALSHEFRTPLNAILGYTDLLTGGDGITDDQRAKLARIKFAVEHLDAIIDEILNLSGLDEAKAGPADTTADARSAARAAVEMCEPVAATAGLDLRVTLPEEPVELTADHDRLRMILVNLMGNAIKFTERGVVGLAMRGEADRVVFEVHDTGVGIAPENHDLIFERFWQVSQGLTRTAGGVGIGLAAARELSRTMGGDIEVRSGLGEGSTFTFWLPRESARPEPLAGGAPRSGPT